MTTNQTPPPATWWTEGNRKMAVAALALVIFGAVAITLIVSKPEGVDIMTFLQWAGGLLFGGQTVFSGANLVEHKIKQGAPTPTSTMAKAGMVFVVPLLLFSGCASTGNPSPDRGGALAAALSTGHLVAEVAKAQAIEHGNVLACYATTITSVAMSTTGKALAMSLDDGGAKAIPALSIDYKGCAGEEGLEALVSKEAGETLRIYTAALTGLIAALKTHILGNLNCEEEAWANASIIYLSSAGKQLIDELVTPDGMFEVKAVAVEQCE